MQESDFKPSYRLLGDGCVELTVQLPCGQAAAGSDRMIWTAVNGDYTAAMVVLPKEISEYVGPAVAMKLTATLIPVRPGQIPL